MARPASAKVIASRSPPDSLIAIGYTEPSPPAEQPEASAVIRRTEELNETILESIVTPHVR